MEEKPKKQVNLNTLIYVSIIFTLIIAVMVICYFTFLNNNDSTDNGEGKTNNTNTKNVIQTNTDKKENINSNTNTNSKEAPYKLILEANYGGSAIDGRDLGSGTIEETYNVSNGDTFYEPFGGGSWLQNYKEQEKEILSPQIIIEILDINEKNVKLKIKNEIRTINYNENILINSNIYVADGINYSYKIRIVKK